MRRDTVYGILVLGSVIAVIVGLLWNIENDKHQHEERILRLRIECIERTDDPEWCLESFR